MAGGHQHRVVTGRQQRPDLVRGRGVVRQDENSLLLPRQSIELGPIEPRPFVQGGWDVFRRDTKGSQQRLQGVLRRDRGRVVAAEVHQLHRGEPALVERGMPHGMGEGGLAHARQPRDRTDRRTGTAPGGEHGEDLGDLVLAAGEFLRQPR